MWWIWLIAIGIGALGAYFGLSRTLAMAAGGLVFGASAVYGLLTSPGGVFLSTLTLGAAPLVAFLFGFMIGAGVAYASYWAVAKLAGAEQD